MAAYCCECGALAPMHHTWCKQLGKPINEGAKMSGVRCPTCDYELDECVCDGDFFELMGLSKCPPFPSAPINEGGQVDKMANMQGSPVDKKPKAQGEPRDEASYATDYGPSVPPSPAAPAPDADGLIARLRWEANNRGLPPFDELGWLSEAADMIAAQAEQIARLTRERDEARAQRNEYDAAHKREAAATLRQMAECERLRALLERWRDEYGGSTFPKTGKPCNKRLDDDTDAALDAARGEGK